MSLGRRVAGGLLTLRWLLRVVAERGLVDVLMLCVAPWTGKTQAVSGEGL